MATNEVYKYSDWIPLPVDPADLQVLPGDPVKVNGLVGVAQAVAGVANTYTIGSMTVTETNPISHSLEDGYMSVALTGAFAFDVTGADENTEMGTPVYFTVGNPGAIESPQHDLQAMVERSGNSGEFVVGESIAGGAGTNTVAVTGAAE